MSTDYLNIFLIILAALLLIFKKQIALKFRIYYLNIFDKEHKNYLDMLDAIDALSEEESKKICQRVFAKHGKKHVLTEEQSKILERLGLIYNEFFKTYSILRFEAAGNRKPYYDILDVDKLEQTKARGMDFLRIGVLDESTDIYLNLNNNSIYEVSFKIYDCPEGAVSDYSKELYFEKAYVNKSLYSYVLKMHAMIYKKLPEANEPDKHKKS